MGNDLNNNIFTQQQNYPQINNNAKLEEDYINLENINKELLNYKNELEENYKSLMSDNYELNIKYENLEKIFIGNQIFKEQKNSDQGHIVRNDKISKDLLLQNNEFKMEITKLKEENSELKKKYEEKKSGFEFLKDYIKNNVNIQEKDILTKENKELKEKIDYFQNRERELLSKIDLASNTNKKKSKR